MNRLNIITQAAKRVQIEKQQQSLKLKGLYRQAVMLSDREYTSKKEVDSRSELVF